jgi:hypothetical protein
LERWTIWLTANGAAGASGLSRSQAASASVISVQPFVELALRPRVQRREAEPTIPALHWAITSAGWRR